MSVVRVFGLWGLALLAAVSCTEEGAGDAPATLSGLGSLRACTADVECPSGEVCPESTGQCRRLCTSDSECGDFSCHPDTSRCSLCAADVECGPGVCSATLGACVQCQSNADCSGGVCDLELATCVQCLGDADCESGVCDEETQQCQQCRADSDCPGERLCFEPACDSGACVYTATAAAGCQGGPCISAADCEALDAPACQLAACVNGECALDEAPDESNCSDGDGCTTNDRCLRGSCVGESNECNDENPCTTDSCNSESGNCVFAPVPDDGPCDDADACTDNDTCIAGNCDGTQVACEDGNVCTDDSCDSERGCAFVPVPFPIACDDGNDCSDQSECVDGACTATNLLDCDDGDPCTTDKCFPEGGCVSNTVPDNTPCNDGQACTVGEKCTAGICGKGATNFLCDGLQPVCGNGWGFCQPGEPASECGNFESCDTLPECLEPGCPADVFVCKPAWLKANPDIGVIGCTAGPNECNATGDFCTCLESSPGAADCDILACLNDTNCDCKIDADCEEKFPGCSPFCYDGYCATATYFSGECLPPCPSKPCMAVAGCVDSVCGGQCIYEEIEDCTPCNTAADCGDNPCLAAECVNNQCEFQFLDGFPCDDSDSCTPFDQCKSGECTGKPIPGCGEYCPDFADSCADNSECGPGRECTCIASCDGCDGCTKQLCGPPGADAYLCESDGECPAGDTCGCLDSACSASACRPIAGCGCEADDDCTLVDGAYAAACEGGECQPLYYALECVVGPNTNCPEGETCIATIGGSVCATEAELCTVDGPGGEPVSCEDGNPCTIDTCLPDGSCAHEPAVGPPGTAVSCNPNIECYLGGLCQADVCVSDGVDPACCTDAVCGDDTCTPLCETLESCPEDCGGCTTDVGSCPESSDAPGGVPPTTQSPWGDCLEFPAGSNVSGGYGDDFIRTGEGQQFVYAGPGDDVVHGGPGDDILFGGAGADLLVGGAGSDNLYADGGADFLFGGKGNDGFQISPSGFTIAVDGSCGSDNLNFECRSADELDLALTTVNPAAPTDGTLVFLDGQTVEIKGIETVSFFPGNCTLLTCDYATPFPPACLPVSSPTFATEGDDCLGGSGFDDTIAALDGADGIDAKGGDDTVDAGGGADWVKGGDGEDLIRGGPGDDVLLGQGDNDELFGGPGEDTLMGRAGDDTLVWRPGDGRDFLGGGCGEDTVRIECLEPSDVVDAGTTWEPGIFYGALVLPGPIELELRSIEILQFDPDAAGCP